MDSIPLELLLFLLALLGGMQSVLTGGSFLILIPTYLLLGFSPLPALLMGRLMVIGSLGTGALRFAAGGHIQWNKIHLLGSGMALGYISGSIFGFYHEHLFDLFLPFLLGLGIIMLFIRPPAPKVHARLPLILFLAGLPLGFLGALGGGMGVLIPVLLSWVYTMEFKKAVLQTRALESINNLIIAATLLLLGVHLPLSYAALTLTGGILGGYLGSHLIWHIPTTYLKAAIALISTLLLIKTFL